MSDDDLRRRWEEERLYDPSTPHADQRLALLAWLHERGVTLEQMVSACERGVLTSVAGDQLLRGRAEWTLRDIADRLGTDVEVIQRMRRAGGFPPIGADERTFNESDLVQFRSFLEASGFFSADELLHLTRVIGTSMRRVAEAASEMFFLDVETPLRTRSGSELDLAKKNLEAIELLHAAIAVFEPMFRAQLQESVQASRAARRHSNDLGTIPLAIGFVDLSGYTSMVEQIAPSELLRAVLDFEAAAYDLVADAGGRVVKLMGDEVMYTTIDAASACDIAVGLLATVGRDGAARSRGGVAFGNVIAHGGDLYGVSVNRASRMADIAVPDEILVDAEVVARSGAHRFEPAGRRLLKGFRDPVPLWSISAAASSGLAPTRSGYRPTMSNEDVESLIAKEDSPAQPPVEEVLDAQRDEAATGLVSTTGPLDLVGPDSAATADEPALAPLINNTGDDGGASSG